MTGRFPGLRTIMFQIMFIVATAQLVGIGPAAASAWNWLTEWRSLPPR